jgi:hypothetical protein
MTIVNRHTYAHAGLLVTGSGDDLDVELELIGGRTLRMSSDGDELGAWPIDECHIEPDPGREGSFRLVVDGDDASFTPTEPTRFDGFMALVSLGESSPAASYPASGAAVADDDEPDEEESESTADDPVAFLFGSSTPRSPVAPPVAESVAETSGEFSARDALPATDVERDTPVDVVEDADTFEDVDTYDVSEPDDGRWIELTASAIGDLEDEQVAEDDQDQATEGRFGVEGAAVESRAVTVGESPEVESDGSSPPEDSMFVTERTVVGAGETAPADDTEVLRSRFGASALGRLSAAIESVTARTAEPEEYLLEPNTVAEEVMTSQRALRDHRQKTVVRKDRLRLVGIVGGFLTVVVFLVLATPRVIDFVRTYEGGPELPPPLEVTATTVVVDQLPVVEDDTEPATTPAQDTASIFALPAPDFVTRWNSLGGPVNRALEFGSFPTLGPFVERFTPFLTMEGVVQPNGTMDAFAIRVDPTGPAEYDRVALQALGVAVATVDPDRSPDGRAALLAQLGLNVRQPILQGIDGRLETNGVLYTLVYDDEAMLLTLTVAPAG